MNIKLTDAGRVAEGYADEKRDCAVRALAVAADIPYYQAHDVFKHGGRRRRCGSYRTRETLAEVGIKGVSCRMSLASFINMNPKGSFYVIKRGHAFAVKDGVVFDNAPLGGRIIVLWFDEVKKELIR